MTAFNFIGSISHGTMRAEDLIPTFIDVLNELKENLSLDATGREMEVTKEVGRIDDLLGKIEQHQQEDDYYESEDADYDLEALFDELSAFAPDYFYFGAHEGDGSDYGFWLSQDAIDEAVQDGEIVKIDAGDEWPTDLDASYVLEVTDHGNMTLFSASDHKEIWSIV